MIPCPSILVGRNERNSEHATNGGGQRLFPSPAPLVACLLLCLSRLTIGKTKLPHTWYSVNSWDSLSWSMGDRDGGTRLRNFLTRFRFSPVTQDTVKMGVTLGMKDTSIKAIFNFFKKVFEIELAWIICNKRLVFYHAPASQMENYSRIPITQTTRQLKLVIILPKLQEI